MSKGLTDRPLYIAIQYVYYFMMTNIYFMLANSLFLLAFVLFELTLANMLVFYFALIPCGPSLAAALATMGKLTREKEIQPTRDFWRYYRKNFVISMKYWLVKWTILALLLIDMQYTSIHMDWLTPILIILLALFLLIMLYAFPILTRFEVKIKNLWIVSIYANVKFFKTTILNISTFVSLFIIYLFAPSITMWFCISIASFFIMFNMKKPFEHLEQELSTDGKRGS